MPIKLLRLLLILALLLPAIHASGLEDGEALRVTITPAAIGRQLVRTSLPLPRNFLAEGRTLVAIDGRRKIETAVRPLSYHPTNSPRLRSARRVIVTFPYDFKNLAPVEFAFRPALGKQSVRSRMPAEISLEGEQLAVKYRGGPVLKLRLLAPTRTSQQAPRREIVETNAFYRWERFHFADPQWPRVIEVRQDAAGSVMVVAHLQRNLPDNGRAPDFGWMVESTTGRASLQRDATKIQVGQKVVSHSYTNGTTCSLLLEGEIYALYHPAAALKRRGRSEAQIAGDGRLIYQYWRCREDERVPMQPTAWQRAELVIAPAQLAPLTATLQSPHRVAIDARLWDELYGTGPPVNVEGQRELAALLQYHHEAVVRCQAMGDDWGNVTSYTDGQEHGAVFGMNRLNHCPAIFREAWRSGDRRLLETALLWCDNFYDQSIWWGEQERGGTRYNNLIAQGKTPPDNDQTYMWRSNRSVNFCTKGYDSFWLAYEESGDPRMLEALDAQVAYATAHVHADSGECRNVGDVREFIDLYNYTGRQLYFDQAMRLFREVRTKLSNGDLFDQSGKPLSPETSFIDDDEAGKKFGYAKPYIIGYALAGLPELASLAADEPKLRDVIRAVADFLAESQDPLGGWRYPHPRSSYLIMSQGIEHAWQLVQADRPLGAQAKHLDAIERVLRQRILGWQRTGKIFAGLNGWEITTGKIKERTELYQLYARPADRDAARDYTEGRPEFGSSSPEGLVYFPEVLAFYLKHRPVTRLLARPNQEEPLGILLARVPETKP